MTAKGALPELAAVADLIGSSTVDGVRVLLAHREGPITAGLFFRVGRADESLATSGITHLVEHLALFAQNTGDVHHNGETGDFYTHFHVTGTEAQVVSFMNAVCASLRDLPISRAETEKEILRTEAARSQRGMAALNRHERFGATGMGLVAHNEVGLSALTSEQVLEWARTRFTSANAVVWITSDELPVGLDLRLSEGVARPVEIGPEIVSEKPAYLVGAQGGVLIEAFVPRSSASTVFARMAGKALFRALRQEGGYSYTATCDYEPIDASTARVGLYADALPEQQAAVIGGMIDVLAALRAGTVDGEDLASAREANRQLLDVPALGAAVLPSAALSVLVGKTIAHPTLVLEDDMAVTAADIAAVADTVWRDALAQIPEGGLEWAGFHLAPRWSTTTVSGESYPRFYEPGTHLIIGDAGVSLVAPMGTVTVLFIECAGYVTVPDGGRRIVGLDGFSIPIEPTLHAGLSAEVVTALDARIAADTVIPFSARKPDDIPMPVAPVKPRGFGIWSILLGASVLVLALSLYRSTYTDGAPTASGEISARLAWACVSLLVGGFLLWGGIRRIRWLGRNSKR